jgi:hypothetical protein
MSRAHLMSRAATVVREMIDDYPQWTPGQNANKGPGLRRPFPQLSTESVLRWAPHVRAATLTQTLLSALAIEPANANEIVVSHRSSSGLVPIVKVQRPTEGQFKAMMQLVLARVPERGDVMEEIISHAGLPWPFWGSPLGLDPQRHPYTFELLGCALHLASAIYYRLKHEFACPRPSDYSPLVLPVIPVPGHSSFPSGHACESYLIARVLNRLVGQDDKSVAALYMQTVAARISILREVAGVHFPADSQAGRLVGDTVAEYFVGLADKGVKKWSGRTYAPSDTAFDPNATLTPVSGGSGVVAAVPTLNEIWELAQGEWQ